MNILGRCYIYALTHWGRVTHICVGKLTIIIWINVGILLMGPLGTNFSEILIEIQTFSLKKIRLKMSSVKYCSFRLGLNVLMKGVFIGSDNGSAPLRYWAITWTNDDLLSIITFRKQCSEIFIKKKFFFKKVHFIQASMMLYVCSMASIASHISTRLLISVVQGEMWNSLLCCGLDPLSPHIEVLCVFPPFICLFLCDWLGCCSAHYFWNIMNSVTPGENGQSHLVSYKWSVTFR